jgi:hypothetical protein
MRRGRHWLAVALNAAIPAESVLLLSCFTKQLAAIAVGFAPHGHLDLQSAAAISVPVGLSPELAHHFLETMLFGDAKQRHAVIEASESRGRTCGLRENAQIGRTRERTSKPVARKVCKGNSGSGPSIL